MMTSLSYPNAIRDILTHLETTQMPAIEQAADLVVAALTNNGAVYCGTIGHGTEGDFINRAGGLAAVQKFNFHCNVSAPVPDALKNRPRPEPLEQDLEIVRFAVKTSNLRAGDVMLVGSVSGKNRNPVELTLACRDIGVRVIGFTSFAYTAQVESLHPSGKKLKDAADVAIDIGAPFGDAALDIPGYDIALCPVSGVAMDVAGWMIWESVLRKMAEAGAPPSVFMSINRPGGQEFYDKSRAEYNKRGY